MSALIWTDLVLALALVLYTWTLMQAGDARRKSGIKSPATTGDVRLERALRVQQNTLEQLIVFIPALLLFARYVNPLAAALLGAIWLVGRTLYGIVYMRNPDLRGTGFGIAFLAQLILMIGAVIGILLVLLRGA